MKGDVQRVKRIARKLWRSHYQFLGFRDSFDLRLRKIIVQSKWKVDTLAFIGDILFRDSSLKCKQEAFKFGINNLVRFHGISTIFTYLFTQLVSFKISLIFIKYCVMIFMKKFMFNHIEHFKKNNTVNAVQNIAILGEAALSETDINGYLDQYLYLINKSDCEYLSLKLSALSISIPLSAYQQRLSQIVYYLGKIADACLKRNKAPFVNIDMEHFYDYDVTIDALKKVYGQKKYIQLPVGIVVQAYLKSSLKTFQDLGKWSQNRIKKGGVRLKIRLVKGANFLEEKQNCLMSGWESFTYTNKIETDANFQKILYEWEQTGYRYLSLGYATHNIFDVALGVCVYKRCKAAQFFQFELLHGMNPALQKVLINHHMPLVMYTPYCHQKKLHESIPYLIRRLDEQSLEGHFMKKAFHLKIDSDDWQELENQFIDANKCTDSVNVCNDKRDKVDQNNEFRNESFTKWYQKRDRIYIDNIIKNMYQIASEAVENSIGSTTVKRYKNAIFPNEPQKIAYKIPLMSLDICQKKIKYIFDHKEKWQETSYLFRKKIINSFMDKLIINRGMLISCLMSDVAKTIDQADMEVSEAIDFCRYYIYQADHLQRQYKTLKPLGVCMIVPPWNFPLAIAVGGIVAALLTGNCVIFKPAHEAYAVSCLITKFLEQAGIHNRVYQMISFDEEKVGRKIIKNSYINKIILTGSSQTAQQFLDWRPDLQIQAETGGKNMMIVTDLCDQDQAIKALLESAFSYAGQKCSAISLLCVVGSREYKRNFYARLLEVAKQLRVAQSHEKDAVITPLVQEKNLVFSEELSQLQAGQSWLIKPKVNRKNKQLWSLGIKLGVTQDHHFYTKECFAPIISIMEVKNLKEAINLINQNPYALTSSFFSLCPNQQAFFRDNIQSGNVYINKASVGAMVARQPFGGWKKSAYGWGHKAGGPYYLFGFLQKLNHKTSHFKAKNKPMVPAYEYESNDFVKDVKKFIHKHSKPLSCVSYRGEKNTLLYDSYDHLLIIDHHKIDEKTLYKWIKIAEFWSIKTTVIGSSNRLLYKINQSSIKRIELQDLEQISFKENDNILIRTSLKVNRLWLEKIKRMIPSSNYVHIEYSDCHDIAFNEVVKFGYSQLISENIQRFGRLQINSTKDKFT